MDSQIYEILRPFARMVAEELAKLQEPKHEQKQKQESRKLRGVEGIMTIFKCSRSKATKLKESGVLDDAITRVSGRIFLIDEQKAIEAVDKKRMGRRY